MDQNGLPCLTFHHSRSVVATWKCFAPHCRTPVPGSAGELPAFFAMIGNLSQTMLSEVAVAWHSGRTGTTGRAIVTLVTPISGKD